LIELKRLKDKGKRLKDKGERKKVQSSEFRVQRLMAKGRNAGSLSQLPHFSTSALLNFSPFQPPSLQAFSLYPLTFIFYPFAFD
jgi:hypothetical protein